MRYNITRMKTLTVVSYNMSVISRSVLPCSLGKSRPRIFIAIYF